MILLRSASWFRERNIANKIYMFSPSVSMSQPYTNFKISIDVTAIPLVVEDTIDI